MTFKSLRRRAFAGVLVTVASLGAAQAATLEVTVTNNQADGGLFLTPLYFAFHDGSFDAFDAGSVASAGIELLAEEGDFSGAMSERLAAAPTSQGGVLANADGFAGAPVLDPGESATVQIDVNEANRYLSFLSMVIPSNDAFIGNDNSMAHEIFDVMGEFTGDTVISITNGNVWDAGTEANTGSGAAFSAAGGVATDTNDFVTLLSSLDFLTGQPTVAGTTVGALGSDDLLATIEVSAVPLPAGAPLILTALGLMGWMRRRQSAA